MLNKLTLLLSVLTILGFGCGRSSTYQTKDGEVKIEQKGNQATYEMTSKDGKTKVTAGESGVALPDDFPKDVPIYKDATVKLSSTQGKSMIVHLATSAAIADCAKFYQDQLKEKGWEIEQTMNMGEATMMSAKKEKLKCTIQVMKNGKETMIQLIVEQEKS
jgi:hypothetical protein